MKTVSTLIALFITWSVIAAPNTNTYDPESFVQNKVDWINKKIENRKPFQFQKNKIGTKPYQVQIRATRNKWLKFLYEEGFVAADEVTQHIADKLIMAKVIERYLGEKGEYYHPKTIGLKAFMKKHSLVNSVGMIVATKEEFLKAMKIEFPYGNIVKPAAGINSQGKSKGFYFKLSKFLDDLYLKNSELYKPEDMFTPQVSSLLKMVSSGEYLVLQENVISAAGIKAPLKAKEFVEVRVHSYENRVIYEASFPRWKETRDLTDAELARASQFIEDFLNQLPTQFTSKQAFGFDVAFLDNGVLRIVDINTNRGRKKQWSGYMPRPNVLGAYTRFFEKNYPVNFAGFNGYLLRNDYGNYIKYLKKKYIEGIH